MEVQRLEALLKAMKSECQGQMERQVGRMGTAPPNSLFGGKNMFYVLPVELFLKKNMYGPKNSPKIELGILWASYEHLLFISIFLTSD